MPLISPVVFPLHPILPGPACACSRGAECGRIGKHPAVPWGELKQGDPVPRPEPGAGVGLKTGAAPKGSGVFVVDIDSDDALARWEGLNGGVGPVTFEVGTGRGLQLYFEHPGFPVGNSAGELAKGIDIRGDGGFVVAPGSPHKNGRTYKVHCDLHPTEAPAWLLTWLRTRPTAVEAQSYEGDVSGPERDRRRELYTKYLQSAPRCVQGSNGDSTLFEVVQHGAWDLALPNEDVLDLITEHYDPRCEPPWGDGLDERVLHKAHSAKTQSTRPRNVPFTETEAELLDFLEPTAHPKPEPPADPDDPDCGFKISWGPWDALPLPPTYLVDGLLVKGKVAMLFAEPGAIKSWTALDVARCVAAGEPWLDEREVVKGPVLYVDFEDGRHEWHRRLHVLAGGGHVPDLGYLYHPGRIDDPEFWLRLATLQKRRGFALIVFDTLTAGTPGVDENDRNAAAPLNYAGPFTEATGATVLVIHHAGKAGDMRGTSAFRGAVDTAFKLETISDSKDCHRGRLTCVKSGQKKTLPINLQLTDEGLGTFEDEPRPEPGEEKDKRTLDQLQAQVLLLIQTSGPIASKDKIRTLVQAKDASVRSVIAELEAKGHIVKLADGWVADNDDKRRARLIAAVLEKESWPKSAMAKLACVSLEFFDRAVLDGWIAPRVSGMDHVGYIPISRSDFHP